MASLLEASEFAQGVCGLCAWLVLRDSAPEPIGQKKDAGCAEVLNVVLHCTGVKDDLCCAVKLAHWEFLVVWVWI